MNNIFTNTSTISIIQEIEIDNLSKLDMECEESKIYSENAEDAKMSGDILDSRTDELEKAGDYISAKKVGRHAIKNYLESIEYNQKAILVSDRNEEVFDSYNRMSLDKIKRSHNNKMINNVIKKGNCQILNDNDLKEMNDIFSNKTNPYNECRYGKELPNTNKRKMIKAIAERVNNNRKDIEEKIKDK